MSNEHDKQIAHNEPGGDSPDITRKGVGNLAMNDVDLNEWRSRRMLFVSGPHASGKSSLVHGSLGSGFSVFDLGPMIRKIHFEQGTDLSFMEWLGHNASEYGPDHTSELLVKAMRPAVQGEDTPNGVVVIGSRSMRGIEYYQERLQPTDSRIIYVDAPEAILHERYIQRDGLPDLSLEAFRSILGQDIEMGLESVRYNADHVIVNAGAIATAETCLVRLIDEWHPTGSTP